MRAFLLGLLVGLCVGSVTIFADLKLRMVHARGQNALPRAVSRQLVDRAIYEIAQETGVQMRVSRFQVIENPMQPYHDSLSKAKDAWASWVLWFRERSEADVNLAVVPPWFEGGKYWLLGYAHTCKRGGTAMATGELRNQDGLDRVQYSFIAIKHELMHVLGASHDDSNANVMRSDAMPYGVTLPNATAIREIGRCGGRWA